MSLKVSRILHAGYVFESGKTKIAFDPIFENPFSQNCFAFPSASFDLAAIRELKLDAVFISHYHEDHCSLVSLDLLGRQTPIYIYCGHDELFSLIRQLGFVQVHRLQIDTVANVGSFQVTPLLALDPDVDSIFKIETEGLLVLNVVDAWLDPATVTELSRQAPWDLVLWPFQTMRELEVLSPSRAEPSGSEVPLEWIEELSLLRPRYIVPSSCQFIHEDWSWYNHALFPISYRDFARQVKSALPPSQIIRLNPSVSIELDRETLCYTAPLPWVHPAGPQDVDYQYKRELVPPSTADIATNFAALTAEQTERVDRFCRNELLRKYESLGDAADYFDQPRYWRLMIYDHLGDPTTFEYEIQSGHVQLLVTSSDDIEWLTEVPVAKLYAALELGESLTSMYMRINDRPFAPDIERNLKNVDVLQDPLVRCLFTGVFGAYQIAQLKRLDTTKV